MSLWEFGEFFRSFRQSRGVLSNNGEFWWLTASRFIRVEQRLEPFASAWLFEFWNWGTCSVSETVLTLTKSTSFALVVRTWPFWPHCPLDTLNHIFSVRSKMNGPRERVIRNRTVLSQNGWSFASKWALWSQWTVQFISDQLSSLYPLNRPF